MKLRHGTSLWVVASVKTKFGWPTSRMRVSFQGREFLLRPETDEHAPSICINDENGLTLQEGNNLINRFLSALAWAQGNGAHVDWVCGSNGDEPVRVGKGSIRRIAEPWRFLYLPQPTDEKALRALAVFREALSLENPAYCFLGLYKVINIKFDSGADQKLWINQNIGALKDYRSLERLRQLEHETDMGVYLYKQGRCAVAHSFKSNVVDPDTSMDARRLEDDIPVMRALAELMISKEFGVPTESEFLHSIRDAHEMPPEFVTPNIDQQK
jgi:hypothetical protein